MIGWPLIAAGSVVALGAVFGLYRFSGWFLPWLCGTLGITVCLAGVLTAAVGWNSLHWERVSGQGPLYTLGIDAQGDGTWRVELRTEGELIRDRVVRGKLLEISGRLLLLDVPFPGAEPSMLYRTHIIRGHDPDSREPVRFRPTETRASGGWVDLWWWDRHLPLPLIRAELLYPLRVPMVEAALFDVVLQGNQIVPIPANKAAEEAMERME